MSTIEPGLDASIRLRMGDIKRRIQKICALPSVRRQNPSQDLEGATKRASAWAPKRSRRRLRSCTILGPDHIPIPETALLLPATWTLHSTTFSHGEQDTTALTASELLRKHAPLLPAPESIGLPEIHSRLWEHLAAPFTAAQTKVRDRLEYSFHHTPRDLFLESLPTFFHDLDALLFQGILRRRCTIAFINRSCRQRLAACELYMVDKTTLCKIAFSVPPEGEPFRLRHYRGDALGTLIHEMLHAYTLILTGSKPGKYKHKEICYCGARVHHGPLWVQATQLIARKLCIEGLEARNIHYASGKRCHDWSSPSEKERNEEFLGKKWSR